MSEYPNVLILTPIKSAAKYLPRYVELIEALDWPREHLALGMLEGDSNDDTVGTLGSLRPRLEARCSRVTTGTVAIRAPRSAARALSPPPATGSIITSVSATRARASRKMPGRMARPLPVRSGGAGAMNSARALAIEVDGRPVVSLDHLFGRAQLLSARRLQGGKQVVEVRLGGLAGDLVKAHDKSGSMRQQRCRLGKPHPVGCRMTGVADGVQQGIGDPCGGRLCFCRAASGGQQRCGGLIVKQAPAAPGAVRLSHQVVAHVIRIADQQVHFAVARLAPPVLTVGRPPLTRPFQRDRRYSSAATDSAKRRTFSPGRSFAA